MSFCMLMNCEIKYKDFFFYSFLNGEIKRKVLYCFKLELRAFFISCSSLNEEGKKKDLHLLGRENHNFHLISTLLNVPS